VTIDPANTSNSCLTIAIDPGHGIWYPGVSNSEVEVGATTALPLNDPNHQYNIVREHHYEHKFALQISRWLKSYLTRELSSMASSFLTRNGPIYKQESQSLNIRSRSDSLKWRAEISNNAKADIFISIHLNSLKKTRKNVIQRKTVEGFEVYYKAGARNSVESKRLAEYILESNKQNKVFRKNRGVKQGNLSVLRNFTGTAGVLVECDFMPYRGDYVKVGGGKVLKKNTENSVVFKMIVNPNVISSMIGRGVIEYIRDSGMMDVCSGVNDSLFIRNTIRP
jgi:N-acetylmuramoyl-L-alanine amidase